MLQDTSRILWAERLRVLSFAHIHGADPAARKHPLRRLVTAVVYLVAAGLLAMSGCARYNIFYNAEKAFKDAERAREHAIKEGRDVQQAASGQRQNYLRAIEKAQKLLDMFPGHGLSDDAVFLQGKAHHRLASYRMSIRQFDLLFANFPRTPYMEEALFLQAVNYLMINDAARSQVFLDLLERQYPKSRFQADALRSGGDNAFALQDWGNAVQAYQRYLERYPRGQDWDNSSLQCATALWELGRCEEAAELLQRVIDGSPLADRVFRARLLLSRCLIQQGELDIVDAMITTLKNEAEIHGQQGMVGLVEAEVLLARGQRGSAVSMLESMDNDHLTREIKPLWANMLGHAYLDDERFDNENLEKARDYFQQALSGAQYLDDPDYTRQLLNTIRDYLVAENQLPDARPERAARLRLQQANALLFSFDRPRMAYDLFAALAADSVADSTVAPRALYGATLLLESTFNEPDSAQGYAQELLARYPDSPQAYKLRSGAEFDLLAFLLAQELAARSVMLDERVDDSPGADAGFLPGAVRGSGLRRQMIYLQRRPNLVFPPPAAALQALAGRLKRDQDAAAAVATQHVREAQPTSEESLDRGLLLESSLPFETTAIDTLAAVRADTLVVSEPVSAAADTVARAEPEPEPKPEPQRTRRWDF